MSHTGHYNCRCSAHPLRRFHHDDLSAASRQGQADPFCATSHIDEHVIGSQVRSDQIEIGVQVTTRIHAKELGHRAPEIARRLWPKDARALSGYCIVAGGVDTRQ